MLWQLVEGQAQQLQSNDPVAPVFLKAAVARFWNSFRVSRIRAALLAEPLDYGELWAAVFHFSAQSSVWFSLLHGAQIESGTCRARIAGPASGPASGPANGIPMPGMSAARLAPGLGYEIPMAFSRLLKHLVEDVGGEGFKNFKLRAVAVGSGGSGFLPFSEALLSEPRLELLIVDASEHAKQERPQQFY